MDAVLVTGAAGFIGFHLAQRLLADGHQVIGVDNLNEYYDPSLKAARLRQLQRDPRFTFVRLDLSDREATARFFADTRPARVAHLAAQAGVRYSLNHPHAYADSNLTGMLSVLEGCRHQRVSHLVFASTSSVYGANPDLPFSEHHGVDHPVSLYAATKRAGELMAHAYSHLFGLPVTSLRFFTVYGPWGRPDMALFLFTRAILEGRPIEVFSHGHAERDFTYVDDVVEAFVRVLARAPAAAPEAVERLRDPASSTAPFRIYNIGQQQPVSVMHLIDVLERALGRTAEKRFLPDQPGDVRVTHADASDLARDTGFAPRIPVEEGIPRFVAWYREFYGV
ncbi:MAG TPA: NAD-dependent epimerase [Gemmatimonadaceae bacterium]